MTQTHVGHDSQVGSRTVFTNGGTLAGHVEVEDDATIGAFSAVHQFCRVGRHAYIGGYSVITMDALPFCITVGIKPACMGVNRIGLERKGKSAEDIRSIERAVRVLTRSRRNTTQALEELDAEHAGHADVDALVAFIRSSDRASSARRGAAPAAPAREGPERDRPGRRNRRRRDGAPPCSPPGPPAGAGLGARGRRGSGAGRRRRA